MATLCRVPASSLSKSMLKACRPGPPASVVVKAMPWATSGIGVPPDAGRGGRRGSGRGGRRGRRGGAGAGRRRPALATGVAGGAGVYVQPGAVLVHAVTARTVRRARALRGSRRMGGREPLIGRRWSIGRSSLVNLAARPRPVAPSTAARGVGPVTPTGTSGLCTPDHRAGCDASCSQPSLGVRLPNGSGGQRHCKAGSELSR